MAQRDDIDRYRENLQDEIGGAAMYRALATLEAQTIVPVVMKVHSNVANLDHSFNEARAVLICHASILRIRNTKDARHLLPDSEESGL